MYEKRSRKMGKVEREVYEVRGSDMERGGREQGEEQKGEEKEKERWGGGKLSSEVDKT